MSLEENKIIARRYFEDAPFNPDACDEIFAPRFQFHAVVHTDVTPQTVESNPQSEKVAYEQHKAIWGGWHFKIEEMIAEDDRVMVRWTSHGRHQGEFNGLPPTGTHTTNSGINIFRIADGKIAEVWDIFDRLWAWQQLGVLPNLKSAIAKARESMISGGRMFKRRLGRSNLEVSAMGLGCWAIGGPWTIDDEPVGWGQVDDVESIRAIHYALDAGINFFDTAANYGCGHSERILSQAIGGRRDKVILATKFGYIIDEEQRVVTRTEDVIPRIRQECEASLRRLQTDYIDLYQFHKSEYPLEKAAEVRDALEDLVSEGKIRWYGWSTDNPAGVQVFAQGAHCTAIQHWLNMGYDVPQMLAACEEHDQASINRSPLGSGMMTGKFSRETTFPEDDMRHSWDFRKEFPTQRLQRIEAVRKFFADAGEARTQAQIALAWIWTRSDRTIPIPGFKTLAQVKENIGAMEFGLLSSEQMQKINEIFERTPVVQ